MEHNRASSGSNNILAAFATNEGRPSTSPTTTATNWTTTTIDHPNFQRLAVDAVERLRDEFSPDDIELMKRDPHGKLLGKGQFGQVYGGMYLDTPRGDQDFPARALDLDRTSCAPPGIP